MTRSLTFSKRERPMIAYLCYLRRSQSQRYNLKREHPRNLGKNRKVRVPSSLLMASSPRGLPCTTPLRDQRSLVSICNLEKQNLILRPLISSDLGCLRAAPALYHWMIRGCTLIHQWKFTAKIEVRVECPKMAAEAPVGTKSKGLP